MPAVQFKKSNHRGQECLFMMHDYDPMLIDFFKTIPDWKFSATHTAFYVPYSPAKFLDVIHRFDRAGVSYQLGALDWILKHNSKSLDSVKTQVEEFRQYLEYKNYSDSTQKTYLSLLEPFLKHMGKPVDEISIKDIEQYIKETVLDQGFSLSYQNQIVNAVKLFISRSENRQIDLSQIERPRKSQYLPSVLSKQEVKAMLDSTHNIKHKAILSLIYSAGLRVGEALSLTFQDIDSKRGLIHIRQGKGNKDRVVGLSPSILDLLRQYYLKHKPEYFLFEGAPRQMYSQSSVRAVLKDSCKRAGISRKIRVHSLRHSYAIHLLESGTDIRFIQDLWGPKNPKTTMIYTHVSNREIKNIISPFDMLDE